MSSEISAGELHFIKQEKDIEEETFDSLIDKALDNVEEDIEKERTNSSLHFVVVPNGDAVDQEEDDREGSDVEDEEFFCYYCSFRCPHRDELAKHISEVHTTAFDNVDDPSSTHTSRLHKCVACQFQSYSLSDVQRHVKEHGLDVISGEGASATDLPSFITVSSAVRPPPPSAFPGKEPLEAPREIWKCPECKLTSENRRKMLNHFEKEHMCVKTFSCEYCLSSPDAPSFPDANSRDRHLKELHHACSLCDFKIDDHEKDAKALFTKHFQEVHETVRGKGYACSHCGHFLSTLEKLDDHVALKHVGRDNHALLLQTCKLCDFKTRAAYELYGHMAKEHGVQRFECEKCDFTTSLAWQMEDHVATHSIKGFACDKCDYRTTRVMFLRRHMKARHSEKTQICPYCPFKSAQRWCVKQHIIQVHEKSRMFKCPDCDYKASSRGNLNVHIRGVHVRDKRFACTQCSFRTSLKSGLMKHIKSHRDSAPDLNCRNCDFTTNSKGTMILHKKMCNSVTEPLT